MFPLVNYKYLTVFGKYSNLNLLKDAEESMQDVALPLKELVVGVVSIMQK